MPRLRRIIALCALAVSAVIVAACGSQGVEVAKDSPYHRGAELFAQRCSGCHTLAAAGTEGSSTSIKYREHTDGPNLNQRKEQVDQVLYAIANGGFSGAIMPQNLAVGEDAKAIAEFVAKYSGKDVKVTPGPETSTTAAAAGDAAANQ